jgi:hypothetical protein
LCLSQEIYGSSTGGVVYIENGNISIIGCTFRDCSASSHGGVLFFGQGSLFVINGSTLFRNNSAVV